jgi:hypothetical protein
MLRGRQKLPMFPTPLLWLVYTTLLVLSPSEQTFFCMLAEGGPLDIMCPLFLKRHKLRRHE